MDPSSPCTGLLSFPQPHADVFLALLHLMALGRNGSEERKEEKSRRTIFEQTILTVEFFVQAKS